MATVDSSLLPGIALIGLVEVMPSVKVGPLLRKLLPVMEESIYILSTVYRSLIF